MSDTKTPRTDAAEERIVNHHGIDAYIVTSYFARQLERELAAERAKTELLANQLQASAYRDKDILELQQRAEQAEARLAEAMETFGGAIGQERRRAELSECSRAELIQCLAAMMRDERLPLCVRAELDQFLSSTEPPALLKEVEELRKRIHELQGVPFSDRNYGAMKDKLNIAREALNEIRSKTTQAGYDSGDSGVCAIAEAAISKI